MPALASLICGFVFGWGLTVSGLIQPTKVLAFLDVLAIPSGAWDPSLAVVMAAGLIVTGIGYMVARRRPPLFEKESLWPMNKEIDRSLLSGALLFGLGWGLVGLCPGPAIANLATLSLPVIVFVIAMTIGMLAYDLLPVRGAVPAAPSLAGTTAVDG
jgi:uncharacterized membrane protein YedE/YeeE